MTCVALAVYYFVPWLPALFVGVAFYYGWEAADHEWSWSKGGHPSWAWSDIHQLNEPRMLTEPVPPPIWKWPREHLLDFLAAIPGAAIAGLLYWWLM